MRTATEWIAEKRTHAALTVIPVLIFAFSFGYAVIHQRQSYFSMDPLSVFQATYPDSPFVAATKVSAYVRQNSSEATFIAVLGSEPEIYFYAKRHSAISYIYMYSLIVRQKYTARMREEMLLQLQTSKPEYLVYVDAWDSWGDRQGGPELAAFLSALHEFMDGNYERVGLADMGETTAYIWGDGAKSYSPLSSEAIYILKRRQPASATPLPSG